MNVSSMILLLALGFPPLDSPEWTELAGPNGLKAWKAPTNDWAVVGSVRTDPANEKRLASEPGTGIIMNGRVGRTPDIVTEEAFGDVDVYVEFMIPKGSNAGIKLEGLYEVQILDSHDKTDLRADYCGGIYPRAELLPTYHHIDKGFPPKVNACKPPGEWQTMYITFHPPKFDIDGKKIENAKFVRVVLNGEVVQENVSVPSPTGHAYKRKEIATGPILLQGDHGPVAFRSVKVKRIASEGVKK
jgi:hypothetical protein